MARGILYERSSAGELAEQSCQQGHPRSTAPSGVSVAVFIGTRRYLSALVRQPAKQRASPPHPRVIHHYSHSSPECSGWGHRLTSMFRRPSDTAWPADTLCKASTSLHTTTTAYMPCTTSVQQEKQSSALYPRRARLGLSAVSITQAKLDPDEWCVCVYGCVGVFVCMCAGARSNPARRVQSIMVDMATLWSTNACPW